MESNFDSWETRLRDIAAEVDYPATPDIASVVRQRLAKEKQQVTIRPWYASRLAWVAAAVLLALAFLITVPQARAAIFEFFQIGSIRIFPTDPTATPIGEESAEVEGATAVPNDPEVTGFSIANLSGETTLEALEAELGDALLLPEYPGGMGSPDLVFLQNQVGSLGILAWLEADSTEQAWAILYILTLNQGAFGGKFQVESLESLQVNGQPAYWVEGVHLLSFHDENGRVEPQLTRLIEGNTLIWTVGEVTYRLETVLSMEEAVRMAESMR